MKKNWTDKEISYITENFNKISISDMAKKLGRTYSAVRNKLESLGFYDNNKNVSIKKEKIKEEKIELPAEPIEIVLDDIKQIGNNAGIIWRYLNANPEQPTSNILKETGLSLKQICLALGWLARENKLIVSEDNKFSVKN
ncbi:MAG TPA: winged helix-turn-helix domain-containing protein [bacterium]|nr:winged helix-turn-helix domain-containing protein [bacterium]HOL46547.1 winged helix-turn-helix domain-containing protein [bacterium]HPQ17882.1 winged helix-turn-helix domain-containing protein [bacterium]